MPTHSMSYQLKGKQARSVISLSSECGRVSRRGARSLNVLSSEWARDMNESGGKSEMSLFQLVWSPAGFLAT